VLAVLAWHFIVTPIWDDHSVLPLYRYWWGNLPRKLAGLLWSNWELTRYGTRGTRYLLLLFAVCVLWLGRGARRREVVSLPRRRRADSAPRLGAADIRRAHERRDGAVPAHRRVSADRSRSLHPVPVRGQYRRTGEVFSLPGVAVCTTAMVVRPRLRTHRRCDGLALERGARAGAAAVVARAPPGRLDQRARIRRSCNTGSISSSGTDQHAHATIVSTSSALATCSRCSQGSSSRNVTNAKVTV